jgi:anti-sigma B factor antagonist
MSWVDDFTVTVHATDDTVRVAVAGELCAFSCHELTDAIRTAAASRATVIELDLAEVEFIDSSGTQCLILSRRDAEAHGTTVKVTAVSEPVQRVLQITGLFARSWATIRSSDLRRHNSSLVCGGYVREGPSAAAPGGQPPHTTNEARTPTSVAEGLSCCRRPNGSSR